MGLKKDKITKMHYYNPLNEFYKSITGAIPENAEITFRVKVNSDTCHLAYRNDGEVFFQYLEMKKKDDFFELTTKFVCGLYWYYFDLGYGKFIGCGVGLDGEYTEKPTEYQLSVFLGNYNTPNWIKGGIIYQIFPDRFCRFENNKTISENKILRDDWSATPFFLPNEKGKVLNNDFFGGDFKGIISKLDYLKSLGVTVIYLNPIFKAYSNHRYDTGDYMQFDELLGTEADFEELVSKANFLGIKIILDGVFNHVGDDSVYFNRYGNFNSIGAYQSKNSRYYSWFNFIDYPDDYSSWWGIMTLPAVNKYNSEYINYITGAYGVIEKYTKMGIGGWRLDVVDELHGGFVREIRNSVKRVNPDAIIIGEVWEDASNKIAYGVRREYFLGRELDSVMNYPLKNAILNFVMHGDVTILSQVVKEQIDHYPKCVLDSLMNILSTHDTYRLLSALSGVDTQKMTKSELADLFIEPNCYDSAVNRLKIASLLQYTLCGVPSLYYGDEVGMQGYTDPLNRRCFPWGNEDSNILEWYRKLGTIRSTFSAFSQGGFQEIAAYGGCYVFRRFDEESEVLIAIYLGENCLSLSFEGELYSLINDCFYSSSVTLEKNQFEILIKK